jgi:hypothetical protein
MSSLVPPLAPLTLLVMSLCRRPITLMSGLVRNTGNGVPHGVRPVLVEQARPGTPMPLMMELGLSALPAVVPPMKGTPTLGGKSRGSMGGHAVLLILPAASLPLSACRRPVLRGPLITVFLPPMGLSPLRLRLRRWPPPRLGLREVPVAAVVRTRFPNVPVKVLELSSSGRLRLRRLWRLSTFLRMMTVSLLLLPRLRLARRGTHQLSLRFLALRAALLLLRGTRPRCLGLSLAVLL